MAKPTSPAVVHPKILRSLCSMRAHLAKQRVSLTGAWCADATLTLGSLARSSQHILVGKVLSTELISTSIDNQTVDCGVGASIRVLESPGDSQLYSGRRIRELAA